MKKALLLLIVISLWLPSTLKATTQRNPFCPPEFGFKPQFKSLPGYRYQQLTLKGIIWGTERKRALVEDEQGRSFIIKEGAQLLNGYIAKIKEKELIIIEKYRKEDHRWGYLKRRITFKGD